MNWRNHIDTIEVSDARLLAGALFQKSFGHPVPDYPRHFVMLFSPPQADGTEGGATRVVGYIHHLPFAEVYLGGGMCIDPSVYRQLPQWLFDQIKQEGGLATIIVKQSVSMLDDAPAVFGHVGEKRARQSDIRAGFVDTEFPHLMVFWRRQLAPEQQRDLIAKVAANGPF